MRWQDTVLEFLFPTPTICVLCGAIIDEIGYCASCAERFGSKRLQHGQCDRCGTFGVRGDVCDVCRGWPQYLCRVRSLWPYQDDVREAVAYYKYRNEPWRAPVYGDLLLSLLPEEAELIVPVPLHSSRLEERGFNQSLLLAERLAKRSGIPVCDALRRVRNTPHQVGLSRTARQENLNEAFAVRHKQKIAGKTVVIIDDVMTTGSTIEHCARELHKAGVKKVYGLVLATGLR